MSSLFTPQEYASLTALIDAIRQKGLSYLEPGALLELGAVARLADRSGLDGCFVEAGCALGGSALALTACKGARPLYCYDVFGLIPPPSEQDGPDVQDRYRLITSGASQGINGGRYYGYEPELLNKVRQNFQDAGYPPEQYSVHFIEGLYQDTLFPPSPVAVAHIDCDWYESVKCCLERIFPCLVPGGRFVIDDYFAWSGCRKAVDEFLSTHAKELSVEKHSRLHLVRHAEHSLPPDSGAAL